MAFTNVTKPNKLVTDIFTTSNRKNTKFRKNSGHLT